MQRRSFIKTAAVTAVGSTIFPTIVPASVLGKNAPSNKIQIGQIGVGRIARSHDMAETIQYDQARFVAVCDVDSKRLADRKKYVDDYYAKKTGSNFNSNVKTYENYIDMLAEKSID